MRLSIRLTAFLLAIVLSGSVVRFFPGATTKADDTPSPSDSFFDSDFDTEEQDGTQSAVKYSDDKETQSDAGDIKTEESPVDTRPDSEAEAASADPTAPAAASALLIENNILIYNAAQLFAVGSDAAVTDADFSEDTFGTGEPVYAEDGTVAVYSSDAAYYLANDILLPYGSIFRLPLDFCGTIGGLPKDEAVTSASF